MQLSFTGSIDEVILLGKTLERGQRELNKPKKNNKEYKANKAKAKLDEELLAIINTGQKIEAIKLCRERLKLPLMESKDYVEALAGNAPAQPRKLLNW